MVDWIFWDNDGVLVATERLYYQACAETLAIVGIDLDLDRFRDISLRRGESVLQLAAEQGLTDDEIENLRRWQRRRYGVLLETEVPTTDGVREALDRLRGKVRMGIVTSCRRQHFQIMHRNTGLLPYFDFILVREDYHYSKPHPEPYLAALARSGLPAERCLAIEDSERGVAAASAAGLACIAIPGELNAGGNFTAARWQIEDLREIPGLIGLG